MFLWNASHLLKIPVNFYVCVKNAVWKYLQNHSEFVKDYRLGGEGEGGLGATVVHLR